MSGPPADAGRRKAAAWLLVPREHGAWGLLLEPFVAGVALARSWDWHILAALGLVLVGFLIREPAVVLARQQWVWKDTKPETRVAWRSLAWQLPLAGFCFTLLAPNVPRAPFLALSAVWTVLTGLAVWMTIRNRQRSTMLQAVSALGLGTTAHLAALVLTGSILPWCWALWGLKSVHGLTSLLLVHARLDLRASGRLQTVRPRIRGLTVQQAVLWSAGLGAAIWWGSRPAAPLLFTAAAHLLELRRLRDPASLAEPLTRVGLRTLAMSLAHTGITIAALW